jgi:hypothetical protein
MSRKVTHGEGYVVESDGITVWVNGYKGLLGRFGRAGIDVHQPLKDQQQKGECLYCTHEQTTPDDWPTFVAKMREHHGVEVPEKHRPVAYGLFATTRCQ